MQQQRTFSAVAHQIGALGDVEHEVVVLEAVEHSGLVEAGQQYLVSVMFSTLHSLVETIQLFVLKDEKLKNWMKVTNWLLERGFLWGSGK